MRIVCVTGNVVTIAAARQELSVLVAAARMALDLVAADPAAPEAARNRLASVLHDYDAALATAPRPGEPLTKGHHRCTSPSSTSPSRA